MMPPVVMGFAPKIALNEGIALSGIGKSSGEIFSPLSSLSPKFIPPISSESALAIPSARGSTNFCQPGIDESSQSLRLQATFAGAETAGNIVALSSQLFAISSEPRIASLSAVPTGMTEWVLRKFLALSRSA